VAHDETIDVDDRTVGFADFGRTDGAPALWCHGRTIAGWTSDAIAVADHPHRPRQVARRRLPRGRLRGNSCVRVVRSGCVVRLAPQVISTRGHALFPVDDDAATIHFLPNLGIG